MKKLIALFLTAILAFAPALALAEPAPEAPAATAEAPAPVDEPQETAPAVDEPAPTNDAQAQPEATRAPITDETVLARINGEDVTYGEMGLYYNMLANQYASIMDIQDESIQSSLLQQAMQLTMQMKIVMQKAVELGFSPVSEEDHQALLEQAQAQYDGMMNTYKQYYVSALQMSEVEAESQIKDELAASGMSVDSIVKQLENEKVINDLYESVTKDVAITDEDVVAEYETLVDAAKAGYEADPSTYDTAQANGATIFYVPEGVRTVKHILIQFDEAAELQELRDKLADEAAAEADKAEAQKRIDEIMAAVQPKLDEVQKKIEEGVDFQELIDAYGEDPGMKAGSSYAESGYPLTKDTAIYEAPFTQAALALAKVGDISEPVLGSRGMHIIRYESDLPSGPVDFETVKATVSETLLQQKKDEAYSTTFSQWVQESQIEAVGLNS